MISRLSPALLDTATPPIPQAKAWLARYDGAFGPPIDLSQAAPGVPPPPELLRRLGEAAADPESARYGPILGDAALRAAHAAELSAFHGGRVAPAEIAITAGCNMAFVAAAMAFVGRGRSIVLPTPWYFNHEMTCRLLGIDIAALPCRPTNGFVPDPAEAEALIDERTAAIVLVSPNNPSGAVYPPAILEAFLDLCRRRGLFLILDETYRDFLPEGTSRPHTLFERDDWRGTLVDLYSFSKAYAVPGHRLGSLVAGREHVDQIGKILDCLQICPARPGQAAIAWAIDAMAAWREANRRDINARAAAFARVVETLPGWRIDSLGAYFAYVAHPFPNHPSDRIAELLATRRGVLGLPGTYFGPGQEGHLRLAFANVGIDQLAAIGPRLTGLEP